jgi:hypothetical protein
VKCEVGLQGTVVADDWGANWDGLERTATTLDQASAECESFGARLPTATELYRVSKAHTGKIGQDYLTNFLWSMVPDTGANQVTVQLSSGNTNSAAATSGQAFRCVCPAPAYTTFSGSNCYGEVGSECSDIGRGSSYNIDTRDRPALAMSSATFECNFYNGHVADNLEYIEAIQQGVRGSNAWLHSADMNSYLDTAQIRWNGDHVGWVPSQNNTMRWGNASSRIPFRCVGLNHQGGVAVDDPNRFNGQRYRADREDNASTNLANTYDTCVSRGGHLPFSTEMAELIQQGLPSGSDAWLRTADAVGFSSYWRTFMNASVRWSGVAFRYDFRYSNSITWERKTVDAPYRCIYYPVDNTYSAPADANCAGGCMEVSVGADAKMWFDQQDRAALTTELAIAECASAGARLANERDLTEAIRAGLPNGSGAQIQTADFNTGDYGYFNQIVVYWTGTDTAFTDQYSAYMTWAGFGASLPFRCMWTNELR